LIKTGASALADLGFLDRHGGLLAATSLAFTVIDRAALVLIVFESDLVTFKLVVLTLLAAGLETGALTAGMGVVAAARGVVLAELDVKIEDFGSGGGARLGLGLAAAAGAMDFRVGVAALERKMWLTEAVLVP
jgi:hypothetical protein